MENTPAANRKKFLPPDSTSTGFKLCSSADNGSSNGNAKMPIGRLVIAHRENRTAR